jgi:hypothetical protein
MKELSPILPIPVAYEALGFIIIAGAGIVALSVLVEILFYANLRPSVKPDASVREKLRPGARSALFAAIKSKDRRQMKKEIVASQEGTEISFNGFEYIGHLVDDALQDTREPVHKRHWAYRLNPRLVTLFAPNGRPRQPAHDAAL